MEIYSPPRKRNLEVRNELRKDANGINQKEDARKEIMKDYIKPGSGIVQLSRIERLKEFFYERLKAFFEHEEVS